MANGLVPSVNMPPPPAIAGKGYRLVFFDGFGALDLDLTRSTTTPHKWIEGVWFDTPNPTSDIAATGGVVSIVWHNGQAVPNTTMRSFQDFRYGYFEINMKFDNILGAW